MKRILVVGALALVAILVAGCGGSHRCSASITLRAVPAKGQRVTPAGMELARKIVASRVNTLGVASPQVDVHGDEIVIEFAGVHNPGRTARILREPGQLQVFDFEPSLAPPTVQGNQQPAPLPSLYSLLSAVQKQANRGTPESYYLFKATPSHPVLQGARSDPPPAVPALQEREAADKHGGAEGAREPRAGPLLGVHALPRGRREREIEERRGLGAAQTGSRADGPGLPLVGGRPPRRSAPPPA